MDEDKKVYNVWIIYDSDDSEVEDNLIGVFSTREKAEEAVLETKSKLDSEDLSEDVKEVVIDEIDLDVNMWLKYSSFGE